MKGISTAQGSGWKASFFEKTFRLFPLIFILVVIPLIVRVYPYYANLSSYPWFTTDDFQVDFFLHGKNVALNVIGVYMLVMLALYAILGNIEKRKPWILIPIAVYAVLALASSAFSPYSSYSFRGNFEGFESIWSVLVYCLIVVYAFYMVRSASEVRVLLYSFSFGVLILTIIGVFQAAGKNPLSMPWISDLTIPAQYRDELSGVIEYNAGSYLTLYNTNYVGVYMSMTCPVLLFLLFNFNKYKSFSNIKASVCTILNAVVFTVLLAGAFYCLHKSDSEAGVLALCMGMIMVPIVFYRKLWKHKIATLATVILAGIVVAFIWKPYLSQAFQRLTSQLTAEPRTYDLTRIHADSEGVTFNYKGVEFTFCMEEVDPDYWVFRAYDANGEPIEVVGDTWVFMFADEPYSDFSVAYYPIDDYLSMSISQGNNNWIFTNQTGTGTYQMLNNYGKWIDIADPERVKALDGKEALFSGRGYIWSRTIPLLKQSMILGSGADTFIFEFPQLDYVGRLFSGYADNQVFTKPHNLYLQMAVQYGIPAMIAFLVFFGMYFVQAFVIYSKKTLDTFEAKAGLGIFIGMIVYMITGLTNDSMIVVSPTFWTLMGIGIVINNIILKKETEE